MVAIGENKIMGHVSAFQISQYACDDKSNGRHRKHSLSSTVAYIAHMDVAIKSPRVSFMDANMDLKLRTVYVHTGHGRHNGHGGQTPLTIPRL